ncbi:pepD [Symbiodinium sp. CCMP2592]|nr:pepD [Symbiodinium sp. CCMP2592]
MRCLWLLGGSYLAAVDSARLDLSQVAKDPTPLCHEDIVDETCELLSAGRNVFQRGPSGKARVLSFGELQGALHTTLDSLASYMDFIDLDPHRAGPFMVNCMELCSLTVASLPLTHRPPAPDVACYTSDAGVVCDIDVSDASFSNISFDTANADGTNKFEHSTAVKVTVEMGNDTVWSPDVAPVDPEDRDDMPENVGLDQLRISVANLFRIFPPFELEVTESKNLDDVSDPQIVEENGTDAREVEVAIEVSPTHSPTDIVGSGDELELDLSDHEQDDAAVGAGTGEVASKRKRRASTDGEDSPTKRSSGSVTEAAVTAAELRSLLGEHLREIKMAWGDIQDRVTAVEKVTQGHKKELKVVHGKTKVLDQQMTAVKAKGDATARKAEDLETKLEGLTSKIEELGIKNQATGDGSDPWGEYLARRKEGQPGRSEGGEERKSLSEEDQRSLILGGWLADTKRSIIESEAQQILDMPALANFVDTNRVVVFGPRKSFGILRFKIRDGETAAGVKARMWEVVNHVRQNKQTLSSTTGLGDEGRPMWASFLKTPEARKKSAMCSMTRRVAMRLAAGVKTKEGAYYNEDATTVAGYDVDWSTGTVWSGTHKLASASHRKDISRNDDYQALKLGWVDIRAVVAVTGCDWSEAHEAFQHEQ